MKSTSYHYVATTHTKRTELMFCVSLLQITSISVFDSLVILVELLINCFKLNDESIAFSSL